jgi:hypothetical protein
MNILLRGACLLGLTIFVGCGGGGPGATVEGSVTLDGQPVQNGTISFVPADGKTASAGGKIADGKYSVAVPPGPKRVEIAASKVVGQRPAYAGDPNSPMIDITESIIPPRYNAQSELTFEVKAGDNQKDFALKGSS